MKRIEFSLLSDDGTSLREPIMVEDCSQLPYAIMQAVEDFLEAHDGQLHLPITIRIHPSPLTSTC